VGPRRSSACRREGYNFVAKNKIAADDQGHGTHVAGTIAQTTNNGIGVAGLAHCAKLMPVKVLSARGWGTMADVAEGIRWAADHGAQVINLSLGSPSKSAVVENAVKHSIKKGVIVVAAAGNSGRSVGYPAAYPGVIAVSATDKNDAIAWFSSRGPEVTIGAPASASSSRRSARPARTSASSGARSTGRAWPRRTSPARPRSSSGRGSRTRTA
jgi:serine protease